MTTPDELKRRILDAVRREPSPTRRELSRRLALAIAAAVVVDLALFFLCGGPNLGARSISLVMITQGGSGLIAVASLVVAFGRGGSMLGRPKRQLLTMAIATPLVLLGWILLWGVRYPETATAVLGRPGLRCLAFSLVLAVCPLALISRVRPETSLTAPMAAGAARGAAVGAIAWVLVGLWCPLANPAHLALGHLLPLLILLGIGSGLGERLTRARGPAL